MIDNKTMKIIRDMQRGEITEYYVYTAIAKRMKDDKNKEILERIGKEEKAHSLIWAKYTQEESKPNRLKVFWFSLLNLIFGYTFTLKLMEQGEGDASAIYEAIASDVVEAKRIAAEEDAHEQKLIAMLDEERLQYVGSMVLGLNDALVELTGTLAGLSLALQNTKLIALSGLVTGISATLSMASGPAIRRRDRPSGKNSAPPRPDLAARRAPRPAAAIAVPAPPCPTVGLASLMVLATSAPCCITASSCWVWAWAACCAFILSTSPWLRSHAAGTAAPSTSRVALSLSTIRATAARCG